MLTIVSFILVISVIVVAHELGHYLVAISRGVMVETFSLGFGKKIFSFKDKRGTEWQLALIPLGGYVKMLGDEDPASMNIKKTKIPKELRSKSFEHKGLWSKFLIVVAGPAASYLLAIIIYFCVAKFAGIAKISSTIGSIEKGSPADKYGLQVLDKVVAVNGKKMDDFTDIKKEVILSTGNVVFSVDRFGSMLDIEVVPEKQPGKAKIGVYPESMHVEKLSIYGSIRYAVKECYDVSYSSLRAIGQIATGKRTVRELGGPIKIARFSGDAASAGLIPIFLFTAFISANLGLMNLLPIPTLDGGHILVYAIEFVSRRKIKPVIYDWMMRIGFFIIASLMLFAILNDFYSLGVDKGWLAFLHS